MAHDKNLTMVLQQSVLAITPISNRKCTGGFWSFIMGNGIRGGHTWPNFCHGPSIFMILNYISLIENFSMLHSSTQLNPMNDVKCQKTFGTCPTTCLCGSPHALHACIHPFTSKPEYPLFKVGLLKRPSVMDLVRHNFHSKIAQ